MFFRRFIKRLGNRVVKFMRGAFRGKMRWLSIIICFAIILFLGVYWPFFSPPSNFPAGDIITVSTGATVDSIAFELKQKGIIRSADIFTLLLKVSGHQTGLIAGDYLFANSENVAIVAARLVLGRFDLTPVKVTVPEGTTAAEIDNILAAKLPAFNSHQYFNKQQFLDLAKSDEGYLFPDTYYFPPTESAADVVATMRGNFNKQIISVEPEIQSFGKPLSDIVIVASMLEKEAATDNDRRIIAGIIWKRLSIGMPLQIDSTLTYALGISTYHLTQSDLMSASPYNTYRYKGLPPTPIGNPGIDAIEDAAEPISTPYLYYVSDKTGTIYYSTTLAEQNKEIQQHL